ncbi:MAG: L17 family ribosomal protein [Candidatus Dojkabacteria bacterium]|uniref:50S ribosomal protein L17 n=1 Tax=Candidatus Dojkabacteria bacterium TaxID=2099670 RepID=A0A952DVM7_9BACT|nr:hypothetical protein [Candidatus Dojkabacteria bacterium]WKZ27883.1 MAG: L17 family ribosomal protein [Candidatus Dojkabacteria bacterium]
MNSKISTKKLGVKKSHRKALKANLLTSLVLYEHITTTRAKAKAVLPMFDKLIKQAKKGGYLASRSLEQSLNDANAVRKVQDVYLERFKKDNNGLVHVFKLGNRKGDNAPMVKLMVKGYEYKEIGTKKDKKADKKEEKQDTVEVKQSRPIDAKKDLTAKSQTSSASALGKAKSRSGI